MLVVVTRWRGKILLGPKRFADINEITHNLLKEHNFVKPKEPSPTNTVSTWLAGLLDRRDGQWTGRGLWTGFVFVRHGWLSLQTGCRQEGWAVD